MPDQPLERGLLICDAAGRKVWGSSDPDLVLIQYEDPAAARLAEHLSRVLLKHGVRSAYRDEYASTILVATKLELIPLRAAVRTREGEVHVSLLKGDGGHVNRQQAEQFHLVSPRQLDCMIDDATHAGRVLRSRLALAGLELVEAQFRFGRVADQGCMMDAFDPLLCRFWDADADEPATDYDKLLERLGGRRT